MRGFSWFFVVVLTGAMGACNGTVGVGEEGESEGEAEGECACGDGELCRLVADKGTFDCVAMADCPSSKVCGNLCCPLGAECIDGACPLPDIFADASALGPAQSSQTFAEDDCAITEGCVDAPGDRTLLRFSTLTPNIGEGDMFLGVPGDNTDIFIYSDCHGHYHFESYAAYSLVDGEGKVVAPGHKQAFCLIDLVQMDGSEPRFNCGMQGISAGWADEYSSGLACQWVDITDVAPGEYTLRVELNYEHVIAEADYENNVTEVPVTIE